MLTSRVEQASQFGELRAVRADLGARDRDAQLRDLFFVEVPGKYGKLGAAGLERAQEAFAVGAADSVENEVDVVHEFLGAGLRVVDEPVGAEVAEKRFMRARMLPR